MLQKKMHDGETADGDLIHMDHQGVITHGEKMYPRCLSGFITFTTAFSN